jgi:hypothetical protein
MFRARRRPREADGRLRAGLPFLPRPSCLHALFLGPKYFVGTGTGCATPGVHLTEMREVSIVSLGLSPHISFVWSEAIAVSMGGVNVSRMPRIYFHFSA